jgi:hypothetical protein
MKQRYIFFLPLLLACSLAASAKTAPKAEAAYDKVVRTYTLHPDGSSEYRSLTQLTLFTHTAMNSTYGETPIYYNPDFQKLVIHDSYTKQADGTIIRTPKNAFVEVLPKQAAKAPAFNRLKEMVVVHTGLELGATIYLDYSILNKAGYKPTGMDFRMPVQLESPVRDCELSLNVPENVPLHYAILNGKQTPTVSLSGGMKQMKWHFRDLPASSREADASELTGDGLWIMVSTYPKLSDALKVVSGQLTSKGDTRLLSLAETVTAGKTSDKDKLLAILSYVNDDIDFSPVNFTAANYRLRPLDDVLASAYATQVEKINLVQGLLQAAGLPAEVIAAYPKQVPPDGCSLTNVEEIFVKTSADGQEYFWAPQGKGAPQSLFFADFEQAYDLHSGQPVRLPAPDVKVKADYQLRIAGDEVSAELEGAIGRDLLPYGADTKPQARPMKLEPLQDGYSLLQLPAPAESCSRAYPEAFASRQSSLLLPYKADEAYSYALPLPDSLGLASETGTKTIDNAVGKLVYSLRLDGKEIRLSRSLLIKKQCVSPADYPAYLALMRAWNDPNASKLLLKAR